MSTLVVIPVFMREPRDLAVTVETLESVRATEPNIEILVVDDHSPVEALWDALVTHAEPLRFEPYRKAENTGFSKTVNVGLEVARDWGYDAVLMNADIHCLTPGWDAIMREQKDTLGRPAAVVGSLLLYPNGLIQHAGIFFSFLTRSFDHRFRYGPGLLPEAHAAWCCPVTGAFQWIRHSTLKTIGLYDEDFNMGYEDVDYCLRVAEAGLENIYQPRVEAVHHESLFRGRADAKVDEWQSDAFRILMNKHRHTNMSRWMMELI